MSSKAECLFALNRDPELARDIKDRDTLNVFQSLIAQMDFPRSMFGMDRSISRRPEAGCSSSSLVTSEDTYEDLFYYFNIQTFS